MKFHLSNDSFLILKVAGFSQWYSRDFVRRNWVGFSRYRLCLKAYSIIVDSCCSFKNPSLEDILTAKRCSGYPYSSAISLELAMTCTWKKSLTEIFDRLCTAQTEKACPFIFHLIFYSCTSWNSNHYDTGEGDFLKEIAISMFWFDQRLVWNDFWGTWYIFISY